MKRKCLTLLMAVSLLATTITGCGDKETTDKEKRIESVENSVEDVKTNNTSDTTPEPSVTGDGVIMEGPSEDGVIEVEGKVTEIPDGEVMESIEGDVIDWSVKYDDYFDRDNIMTDKPRITISSTLEGVVAEKVVAAVDEDVYLAYDFGTAAMEVYVIGDKVYALTRMEGEEVWYWAPVVLEESVDVMLRTADTTPVDREDMAGWTYREAIEEDGVIYDVLDVAVTDDNGSAGTAVYFVNRDTQLIEKYVMEDQESTAMAVCLVEEIESIELPAEAEHAMEVTMEDILEAMVNVFFIGANIGTE